MLTRSHRRRISGTCLKALAFLLAISPAAYAKPVPPQAADCTTTVASANLAAVQSALNAARSGSTVCVPAGSATWRGVLEFPANKDLTLKGADVGATVIDCGTVNCLTLHNSGTLRVTGFTFIWSSGDQYLMIRGPVTMGKTFRIDHNIFNAPNSTWSILNITGDGPAARHPTGLIDNNRFVNFSIHFNGTNFSLADGDTQHQLWSQPLHPGDGADVVFVEDNQMISTRATGFQNYFDGNYGARFVVRFNTMSGHGTGVEVHSVQGRNRAVRQWEIYGNTFTKDAQSFYPVAFLRGGTGVVFDNTASAAYTNDILLDNVRSMGDPGGGVAACDGASTWDGGGPPVKGYPCRDQIGRGGDEATWKIGAAYTQPLMPAYFWNNKKGSGSLNLILNAACGSSSCLRPPGNNPIHLVQNRDWYTSTATFAGTAGVGRGTLAARPSTCTPGVAYWVTDQGEWNSKHAGPDGQLYKCTSKDAWTLYYTPYVYPHPLQRE